MSTSIQRSIARRGLLLALLAGAPGARGLAADPVAEEVTVEADSFRVTQQERPFAWATDPTTPSRGVVSFGYLFGLGSGISEDRPLPVNMATASGSSTLQLGYGVTDRLAPFLAATVADAGTSTSTQSYGAGVAYQLTNPFAHFRATISAEGLHDARSGANTMSMVVAASGEQGPLRMVANGRADRTFASGADGVDLFGNLGAAWRLGNVLWLGAEYVGEDLEETFSSGAEGGSRHSLGPTLALDFDRGRYQVALGAGFGLTAISPRAIARAVLAFNF